MSKLLCVTNRSLCREDFLIRLERICAQHPAGIILREKDLSQGAYEQLAWPVLELCRRYEVPCILHSFVDAALRLEAQAIHLPLPILRTMTAAEKARFSVLGASCHSVEDAREAQDLGCTYITAGHVFDTDCKKGLPGRGLEFLQAVCHAVTIPVYAIGGIGADNFPAVLAAGAAGGCAMSGPMVCHDPAAYFEVFEKAGDSHEI